MIRVNVISINSTFEQRIFLANIILANDFRSSDFLESVKIPKTYASYRLVGLATGKIITSPNSLIPAKPSFSNILLSVLLLLLYQ